MHKKGNTYIALGSVAVFATLIMLTFFSNMVSATQQTCTTDDTTGVVTCSNTVNASVIITPSCGFVKTGEGEYSGVLANNSDLELAGSTFTTTCNSPHVYALYAVGFSNSEIGNTNLVASIGSDYNIATDGANSYWQLKITSSGDYGAVATGYSDYAQVPNIYTKVAYYTPASGDTSTQSVFQPSYKAHISSAQPAGTYTGQVKFTLVPTVQSLSKSIFELTYLQDFKNLTTTQDADVMTSMIIGDTYTLKDSRNDNVYYVSKNMNDEIYVSANSDMSSSDLLADWLNANAS